MKKILFIILPLQSATGICTQNVANQFVQNGWAVDILSFGNGHGERIENGIRYFEVKESFLARKMSKLGNNTWIRKILFNIYRVKVQLLAYRWPLYSITTCLRVSKKTKKLDSENDYDCVVPVYAQLDAIIAGYQLKKERPTKVVIPYFLDAISAGSRPRILTEKSKIRHGQWWERKLLENSDGVIFMESSRKHHELHNRNEVFFDKCVFLDIPSLIMCNEADSKCKSSSDKEELHMTYVGTLPLSIRNPLPGLQMLSQLDLKKKIIVHMVGPVPESKEFMDQCAKLPLKIDWVGAVSHEAATGYIQKADVLLNFGNRVAGMVPSKIFEYISYLKPILSFSPKSNDPSIPYIRRYPLGYTVLENATLEQEINIVKEFLNTVTMECEAISSVRIKELFSMNTPECVYDYIYNILK